jgi:PAS domain S-box-containing protein
MLHDGISGALLFSVGLFCGLTIGMMLLAYLKKRYRARIFQVTNRIRQAFETGDYSAHSVDGSDGPTSQLYEYLNQTLKRFDDRDQELKRAHKLQESWAGKLQSELIERKRLQKELVVFKKLVDNAAIGMAMADLNYRVTYVNRATLDMLEIESDKDILNDRVLDFYPEEDRDRLYNDIVPEVFSKGQWSGEVEMLTKSGNRILTSHSAHLIRDNYGQPELFVAVFSDLREKNEIEKQKHKLQQRLERAEKMEALGLMAGGVAHDLNNMFGPLVGYPDLLLMELPEDSPLRIYVQRIGQAARDASDVIQDLLTLARRGRYELEPVVLNNIVKSFIESPTFEKYKYEHGNVTIEVELEKKSPNIMGSHLHLYKAIMNLIVNGFEAMPSGGRLKVSTSHEVLTKLHSGYDKIEPGEYQLLRIKDTGVGIDREEIPKMFEPYYSKKTMGSSGSGLGLAIVYGIVKDHHGYYDVFSETGKGTEFVLYFPTTREKSLKPIVPDDQYAGSERILVVDDDHLQQELIGELLKRLGYKVTTVSNGHEAIKYLTRNEVELVILDMILETDYNGFSVFRDIQKINPDQKCLVISGFSPTDQVFEMQNRGAGSFIRKPFDQGTLARAVRAELDRKAPLAKV